ncbi:C39 family peptidase [Ferruginivarius sediminum]|nr:C39 family peptidase [Ferruginivarius sediminum]
MRTAFGINRMAASVLAVSLFLAPAAATAQQPVALPSGGLVNAPVKTYTDLRFDQVIRQAYDLSCGAAAVATLLKHGWDVPTDEKQVIDTIVAQADQEQQKKIAKSGFSMLELKEYGESRGFAVGGFRIDEVEKLQKLKVPAITLTNIRGYNHFVVIKGVRNGRVFVADPAFGNRVRSLEDFDEEWNGVVLVFVRRDLSASGFKLEAGAAPPTRELVVLLNPVLSNIRPLPGEF